MATRLVRHVISSTEIAGLPILNFGGRIKLVDLANGCTVTTDEIRTFLNIEHGAQTVGFDTEAKPSPLSAPRNRTALIQLASETSCILFRTVGSTSLPPALVSVLQDPLVAKVGQGIGGDVGFLQEDFGVDMMSSNLVDLHAIACKLNCQPKSLQGLVGLFLQKRLLKDMRISNWEEKYLRNEQIQYAAIDAWAARAVYIQLLERNLDLGGKVCVQKNFPSPPPLISPVASVPETFASPQVELVNFCLVHGHVLRLGSSYKCGALVKAVFEVTLTGSQAPLRFTSLEAHKSVHEAQKDAAQAVLMHFHKNPC